MLQLTASGLGTDTVLGWLNGSTWDLAVNGNTGTAGGLAGYYGTSFSSFLAGNGGSFNSATMLGAYGFDSGTGSLWSVVDFGGDFTAIPEPSSAMAGTSSSASRRTLQQPSTMTTDALSLAWPYPK